MCVGQGCLCPPSFPALSTCVSALGGFSCSQNVTETRGRGLAIPALLMSDGAMSDRKEMRPAAGSPYSSVERGQVLAASSVWEAASGPGPLPPAYHPPILPPSSTSQALSCRRSLRGGCWWPLPRALQFSDLPTAPSSL